MAEPDLERAKQIFGEALQRPVEDQRDFVAAACGDDEVLRRRVQRLVAAHQRAGEFLEDPTAATAIETILQGPESPPLPKRIGRYRIKRVIASGGMGVVYEAVQEQPHRSVALKVMRPGLTSTAMLRRFEYESQILGRLRHPNIAQVYEAGTHDDVAGPVAYFAMEYIPNARSLVEYAAEKGLTTTERLDLFTQVCDAVHHGHQKGVIHRDLKPSNILVDTEGIPKIIDFGVARATNADLAVTTVQTDVGQLIGTLQYMSPEQCEADPHDIDSRSDVYALGVVLYELLCARLPYEIGHAAVHEAVRVIRTESPARPSTIDRTLRGDLETITLMALEKDRTRRYQSASDLAADIRRHLADEPIVARPASALYQLQKFARRNKALVAGAISIVLLLIVGIAGTGAGFIRASREAHKATVTNEYLMRLFGVEGSDAYADPEAGTEILTLKQLVDGASDELDLMLAEWPELRADMHFRLGRVYWRLGKSDEMSSHLLQAHDLYQETLGDDDPRTLVSLFWYAYCLDGATRYAEAEDLHRRAFEGLAETCGPGDRRTLSAALRLAINLRWQAKYEDAERLFQQTLKTARVELGESDRVTLGAVRHYAFLLHNRARHVEEEALVRPALKVARRTLPQGDLVLAKLWWSLGTSLRFQGRFEVAAEAFEAAHVVHHFDKPGVIQPAMYNAMEYAKTLSTLKRNAEAESLIRQKIEDCRRELGENHKFTLWARYELGSQLHRQGDLEQARVILRETYDYYSKVRGADDYYVVFAAESLARLLLAVGELEDALQASRRAYDARIRANPDDQYALTSRYILASILRRMRRFDDAEQILREQVAVQTRVHGADGPVTLGALSLVGLCLTEAGNHEDAEQTLRAALAGQVATSGELDQWTLDTRFRLADVLRRMNRFDDAEPEYLAVYAGYRSVRGGGHRDTHLTVRHIVSFYETWGKPAKAAEYRALLQQAEGTGGTSE